MPGTRLQALRSWRPWAGLAVGLVLTLFTIAWTIKEDWTHARERFDVDSIQLRERIVRRMAFHEQLLRASAEYISQREALPSQEAWTRYVKSLELNSVTNTFRGFGVVAWHPEALGAGIDRYSSLPPQAPGTSAVLMVEPLHAESRGVLSRNLYAEPLRRVAMARACDTGVPALTMPVSLYRESPSVNPTGVLFFAPIYRPGRPLGSVLQRRDALIGWVYLAFRMEPLMASILERSSQGTGLEAYIDSGMQQTTLLCSLAPDGPAKSAPYFSSGAVEVYRQLWYIRTWPGVHSDFFPRKMAWWFLLLFGGVVSSCIFYLLYTLERNRYQLLDLAGDRLERIDLLTHSTVEASSSWTARVCVPSSTPPACTFWATSVPSS